jgi:hypothetical protein
MARGAAWFEILSRYLLEEMEEEKYVRGRLTCTGIEIWIHDLPDTKQKL